MNNLLTKQFIPQEEITAGSASFTEPTQEKMKGYVLVVDETVLSFSERIVTGKNILIKAGKTPVQCFTLYQKLQGCDFEKVSLDEEVNLAHPGLEHFVTKEPEVFNYHINNEPETTDKKHLTPVEILKLAGIDPHHSYLVHVLDDGKEEELAYEPEKQIKMLCTSMKFITRHWLHEVNIEEYGKACKPVPPALTYKVRIDKSYIDEHLPVTTGKHLLTKANKLPAEKYDLFKIVSTNPQPQKIHNLDAPINLREECLVRFVTLPKEQQDGEMPRRTFSLPVEDADFLNEKGFHWETLFTGGKWLLINNYPIPDGYNVTAAQVALQIPPNYPAAEIDMVYFYPYLQKANGRGIPAITPQPIDGKMFQRWSRHRTAGQWRPGEDNVMTHLLLVNNWLEKDVNR